MKKITTFFRTQLLKFLKMEGLENKIQDCLNTIEDCLDRIDKVENNDYDLRDAISNIEDHDSKIDEMKDLIDENEVDIMTLQKQIKQIEGEQKFESPTTGTEITLKELSEDVIANYENATQRLYSLEEKLENLSPEKFKSLQEGLKLELSHLVIEINKFLK